ncbi:MAG: M48 family metallopeptidase [Bacteroidia bacterium]|nr:M48 family metallopeptidase [Bacteroidia bacterium]
MMERVYKARYFDGHSSSPKTVDVTWVEAEWHIQFYDNNNELVKFIWQTNHIKQLHISNGILSVKYGDIFPQPQLDITDQDFIQRYKQAFPQSFFKRFNVSTASIVATAIVFLVALIWASYVWFLPALANYGAKIFPKKYEIELGKKMYAAVLQNEVIDTAKTQSINQFFNQLKIEKSYPVKITVVNKNVINAFAMPGGGIVVYDAILKQINSAEELAALLAHEYSHVELKHATRNIFTTLSGYLLLSVIFGDMSGVGGMLIENANQLRNLSYSRKLETEADNSGLLILKNNNLNAKGMIALFDVLKKESDAAEVNEMVSTHPDLDKRILNVEQFIKDNPYKTKQNDSLNLYFNQLKNNSNWNE